uniref:Claudin n=1 Tax=Amphiprion percula TaxID=161767 RepID=A0A3P8SKB1_AMPPE
ADPSVCRQHDVGAGGRSALAATLMSSWLTLSTELLPSESYQLGLWETCVVQDLGLLECRPYDGLLGLPPDIKLARVLMCGSLGTGLLAVLLAVPGLSLVNGCRGHAGRKTALRAAGGVLVLAAGVLAWSRHPTWPTSPCCASSTRRCPTWFLAGRRRAVLRLTGGVLQLGRRALCWRPACALQRPRPPATCRH